MAQSYLLQFFAYEHLPAHLQETSKHFAELAQTVGIAPGEANFEQLSCWIEANVPGNVETTFALMKLEKARFLLSSVLRAAERVGPERRDRVLRLILEAKDCAVRARLYKPVAG